MSAFGDLTTLHDVKQWLSTGGSPGSSGGMSTVDDGLLTRLISSASRFIQEWLNIDLALQDWIETRDWPGYNNHHDTRFSFARYPVTAVAWVACNGVAVTPVPMILPGPPGPQPTVIGFTNQAGYLFTPTQLIIRGGYGWGYGWGRSASVTFQYTAGYSRIPTEIAQACVELVALRYRERDRIGQISKSIGGSETVSYSLKDMSDSTKTLLQQYRAVVPITAFVTQAQTQTDPAILVAAA